MIAVLRVRFTSNSDPATVWSDATFQNWLNPSIPFSLANFWWESSWGYFDLRTQLFPAQVLADPRPDGTVASRPILVNAVLAQADTLFHPAWEQFDLALIWCAQPTDQFGGRGPYPVPLASGGSKPIAACVVDLGSPFDGTCEELGHAFGLQHERDFATPAEVAADDTDYKDPYSVMSARRYGAAQPDFFRPSIAGLPDGSPLKSPGDRFDQLPAGRIVGPMLTPAQLLMFPWFGESGHVVSVPQTYQQAPVTVKLYALDHARALASTATLPVMAVIGPVGTSYWQTFEFRRPGQRYDQAIGDGNPAAGIVMHAVGVADGLVRYTGVLPLDGGDLDIRTALFTARLVEVGPDDEWAKFTLLAGSFADQHAVRLEEPVVQATDSPGPAVGVLVDRPCLAGSYTFQEITTDYAWTQIASSQGFDAPRYRWYLNDVLLTESPLSYQALTLGIEMFIPPDPTVFDAKVQKAVAVSFTYRLSGNRLDLRLAGCPGNFTLAVKVVAYSDKTAEPVAVEDVRYLQATCLRYKWDARYRARLAQCYDWMDDVVNREYPPLVPDPGDPLFHVADDDLPEAYRVLRALAGLREQGSERAGQLVEYLGLRYNVPTADLTGRMTPGDRGSNVDAPGSAG